MYMRLAFAVAAHLDPEILIVDEVLAVGDVAFQKKCLGKMGEASRGGRTVLFVSHNMAAIQQLAKSCVLLEGGHLAAQGRTPEIVNRYLECMDSVSSGVYELTGAPRPYPDLCRDVEFVSLSFPAFRNSGFQPDEEIRIHAHLRGNKCVPRFRLSFSIFRSDGSPVGSGFSECHHSIREGEIQDLELVIGSHNLAAGRYHLGIATGVGDFREGHTDFDVVLEVCHFEVLPPEGDHDTVSVWSAGWGPIRFEQVHSRRLESVECSTRS